MLGNSGGMMKIELVALAVLAAALPAAAQQPPQEPPTVAAFVRNLYMGRKSETVRSAEKMPEEFYGLRPGDQPEVRTFGQHLAHIATFNFLGVRKPRAKPTPTPASTSRRR